MQNNQNVLDRVDAIDLAPMTEGIIADSQASTEALAFDLKKSHCKTQKSSGTGLAFSELMYAAPGARLQGKQNRNGDSDEAIKKFIVGQRVPAL